mmetsp:Transcript_773/g.2468  ORF Transcript_773/g.2468 Transcript_773/m.2468 type:complete len:303 (-) Transcript_773:460-1368(-)
MDACRSKISDTMPNAAPNALCVKGEISNICARSNAAAITLTSVIDADPRDVSGASNCLASAALIPVATAPKAPSTATAFMSCTLSAAERSKASALGLDSAFLPPMSIPTLRKTAHTNVAAAAEPRGNLGSALASNVRPFGSVTMRWNTPSCSAPPTASTGTDGKRNVLTNPSSKNVRRLFNSSSVSLGRSSSSWRSMSSTSSNKHMESSIIIRAAKSGSCSNRRCVPSSSSSPPAAGAEPEDTSKRGLGDRMLPKGTLPRPAKPGTKVTGPRASFSCDASSRNVSGQKGSFNFDGLLRRNHD